MAIPHTQLFNQGYSGEKTFLCARSTCLLSRISQAVRKFGTKLIRKKKDSFLQSLIRKRLGVGLQIENFGNKNQKLVLDQRCVGQGGRKGRITAHLKPCSYLGASRAPRLPGSPRAEREGT